MSACNFVTGCTWKSRQVKRLLCSFLMVLVVLAAGSDSAAGQKRWIEPRCEVLRFADDNPLVELSKKNRQLTLAGLVTISDGSLLSVDNNGAVRISQDGGKTWSKPRKVYDGPGPGIPGEDTLCSLARTHSGVLVFAYEDASTQKWGWDDAAGEPVDGVRNDVWAIRSLDEGKTWVDRQRIYEGCSGGMATITQTTAGPLVVAVSHLLRNPGRWAQCTCVSSDDGKTWKRSNLIDLGGHGHHDGAMEGTVVSLQDGRLWMLLRTTLDRFWEAYSDDRGLSWRVIQPSRIDASCAPGRLARLASGRLLLVWNRLYPEGKNTYWGHKPPFQQREGSWHREELSIALSDDDGENWTTPVVIARQPGGGSLGYPYVFERRPGELWITTRYNTRPPDPLWLGLREADFVHPPPLSGTQEKGTVSGSISESE